MKHSLFSLESWLTGPTVVSFFDHRLGRVALVMLFAIILFLMNTAWWPVTHDMAFSWAPFVIVTLALTTLLPVYRWAIISTASVLGVFVLPWFAGVTDSVAPLWLTPLIIVLTMLFCMSYLLLTHYRRSSVLGRYPIACLLVFFVMALFFVSYLLSGTAKSVAWTALAVLSTYLWYLSYGLLATKKFAASASCWHVLSYCPFWGGTSTPFPKGRAYLETIACQEVSALTQCQLRGLYLLLLAALWRVVLSFLIQWHSARDLPFIGAVLQQMPAYQHQPSGFFWQVLCFHFLYQTMSFAMNGHIIISIVRMSGFNAARNMDNPFFATSISDFWNRYYYYFKELLVDLFFFPTYFRCFKKQPVLRLAFATLMAAGVGNALYHFLLSFLILLILVF